MQTNKQANQPTTNNLCKVKCHSKKVKMVFVNEVFFYNIKDTMCL